MTALLQQALDALETCTPADYSTSHIILPSYDREMVDAAITALRHALAAPAPAVPDWMHKLDEILSNAIVSRTDAEIVDAARLVFMDGWELTPAAPAVPSSALPLKSGWPRND